MKVLLAALKWPPRALIFVSYAAILVLLCLTVWDVVNRYVFSKTTSGVTEVSQILLVISTAAIAHAIVEGRYIQVGVIVDRLPKVGNFVFEIVMAALAIFYFFIVGWQLLELTTLSVKLNEYYLVSKIPRWPMYLIMGISFLACILATVVYVIERIRNYKPPTEVDFFDENPDLAILALAEDHEGEAAEAKGGAV